MEEIKPVKDLVNFQDILSSNTSNGIKEVWKEIYKCKQNFLNNNEDPRLNPYINPEVALSWIRSRDMGVNLDKRIVDYKISDVDLKELIEKNRSLMDIARPLFYSFRKVVENCHLVLADQNDVVLLKEGHLSSNLESTMDVGVVFSEENVGTTAHHLSVLQGCPIKLLGSEFYHNDFHDIVSACAAPIRNENGDIIGSLSLVNRLAKRSWEHIVHNMYNHSLGMVAAMATSIENELRLRNNYHQLEKVNYDLKMSHQKLANAHDTLDATFSYIDEGIILIDRVGKIIQANKQGKRLLKLRPGDIDNINIFDYLSDSSGLQNLIEKGKLSDLEETIFTENDEQAYIINILPVVNKETNRVSGAVLRLNLAERVNALVTKRSGAIAHFSFQDIIGESKEFRNAVGLGQRLAKSPENVLLIGESGTGKEMFAQAMHNESRSQGPFIAVNCAAMPRNLIESELFGYEGGSFTGADRNGRPGKIELANGGTLFLDEIGDMPYEIQPVLLRVLQDKQVMRIGGQHMKKVNFRVIAATNKDIFKMVEQKLFREDLYYRLSVLSIPLPPLRHRGYDAELLSRYFVKDYCGRLNLRIKQISMVALEIIREYDWPGNVRQLENAMIYAVNISSGEIIEPEHLPNIIRSKKPVKTIERETKEKSVNITLTLKDIERNAIENALFEYDNNITHTADILGVSKNTLYKKIRDYNISR